MQIVTNRKKRRIRSEYLKFIAYILQHERSKSGMHQGREGESWRGLNENENQMKSKESNEEKLIFAIILISFSFVVSDALVISDWTH